MSPTTRDTPHSAATSFNRIEFAASVRAGAAWIAWLIMAVVLIVMSGLPGLLQSILGGAVAAAGGVALWRCVFLQGPRALRALEWSGEQDACYVCLGESGRRLPAVPDGCRRYIIWWLLRFRTPEGTVEAVVDVQRQDAQALRRLARHLFRESNAQGSVRAAGLRGTDTIRPKV